jgi:Flp pilus assembly protein TadD
MSSFDNVVSRAREAAGAGDFAGAEALLSPYLEEVPDDRDARFLRGLILAKAGKFTEAEDDFVALTEKDFRDFKALNNLAVIYGRQDKLQYALGTLTDAIDIDPTEAILYYNVGNIYERLGNFKAASMAYAKMAELSDGYIPAYNKLGITQFKLGLSSKALETFSWILATHPAHPGILNNMGVVLAGQGEITEAIKQYRQALELDPHYTKAKLNLERAEGEDQPDLMPHGYAGTDFLLDEEPDFLFIEGFGEGAREIPKAPPAAEEIIPEKEDEEKTWTTPSETTLDLMRYLRGLAEGLPARVREIFLRSDARLSMEYIIAVLEGHAGIFKEIRSRELSPEIPEESSPAAVSGGEISELTETLSYLRKMTEALADQDLSAALQRKMDTVISELEQPGIDGSL